MLLNYFSKVCATIAVPTCVTALYKNTATAKARINVKFYNPSKLDKYSIQFYSNVKWMYGYLHLMVDINSGNSFGVSPVDHYVVNFPTLMTPLKKSLTQ